MPFKSPATEAWKCCEVCLSRTRTQARRSAGACQGLGNQPVDGAVRMGSFPMAAKPPLILCEEASGVIEINGEGFKARRKVIIYGGGLGLSREEVSSIRRQDVSCRRSR
jgi:hypothetical protein